MKKKTSSRKSLLEFLGQSSRIQANLKKSRSCCLKVHKFLPFFRINEKRRIRWDLFIMILATYNCIALPYEAAFMPDYLDSAWHLILNFIVDFFFFIDMLINLRTTIINDKTGEEIKDPWLVAKHYL